MFGFIKNDGINGVTSKISVYFHDMRIIIIFLGLMMLLHLMHTDSKLAC